MKEFFTLTKTLVLCGLDLGNSESKFKINRNVTNIVGVAVIVALAAVIVKALMDAIAGTIAAGGNAFIIVEQGMAVGMLAALVMGIPMVLSAFYSSSDTTTLLSFPISITTIASARFVRCLVYDYSLVILFSLPPFVAYGLVAAPGALYWVFALLLFVLLPITPLVYDTVIAMILMRVFRGLRNKKLLTTIGTIVTFAFCAVWVFMSMQKGSGDSIGMEATLSTFGSLGSLFPSIVLANLAIEQISLVYLLLFIVATAAFVVLFVVVARLIYFDSVIGMSESSSRNAALSGKEVSSFGKARKPQAAYLKVEQRKMLHSPFIIQMFLSELLWPIILVASLIFGAANNPDMDLNAILAFIANSDMGMLILVVLSIAMSFLCSSSNFASAMAISLEGVGLSFLKTLPLRFRDIVDTKVRAALYPDYFIANAIPLIATLYCIIVNDMESYTFLPVFVVGFLGTYAVNYIQITFDLNGPKLDWSDQATLNRKFSTILSMFVIFAIGLALCLVTLLPVLMLGVSSLVGTIIGVVATTAVFGGARALALSYGEKRLHELP